MTKPPRCKDCGPDSKRPAPHPGPRCATHHRERKRHVSATGHARRLKSNFGMTAEQYWALIAAQGGRCYICQRANGRTKRLAVDHDHRCAAGHPPDRGCPQCWRAALCGPCNQMIGRLGVEALFRAIEVLTDPPARKVLF